MKHYSFQDARDKDEEWARNLVDKKTEIRNFRSDEIGTNDNKITKVKPMYPDAKFSLD